MELKKGKGNSRVTLDLPIELHKRLKVAAALNGISMRDLLIEALEKKLKKAE
jgi:predicted HicB family RNase H-like nuclease